MFVPACLVALALTAPPPAPVAHVVAGTKNVTVKRDGKSLPVALDLALTRTDELHVPPRGLLLVRVDRNGLVVRIDEDLDLTVGDIAALDVEQKTGAALGQQIDALLTQAEKQPRGSERLVGWFVSPTAANVPSVASAGESAPTGGSRSMEAAVQSPEAPQQQPSKAPAPPPPSAAPPVGRGPKADVVGAEQKRQTRSEGAVLQLTPAAQKCFADWAALQPPAVRKRLAAGLTVRVRLDDVGVRLFLEGALPATECMQSWAATQAGALSSAWSTIEVPLK